MFKAGFYKKDRSTFRYWFAHWCSFNMTALNLNCWKFKYLFHDIEKPFLKLIYSYEKVQKIHRNNNKHHIEYFMKYGKADWEAMCIDWECSPFTKAEAPMDARESIAYFIDNKCYPDDVLEAIKENMIPLVNKWGI